MEIRNETFQILYNIAEEVGGSPELYHTLVSFIQYQANEKNWSLMDTLEQNGKLQQTIQ